MSSTQRPLPGGWHTQVSTTSGETYYVNSESLASQYEFPSEPTSEYLAKYQSAASSGSALPAGWATQKSRSTGDTYYINEVTGESQFEVPTAPAGKEDQLAPPPVPASPGAAVNSRPLAPLADGAAAAAVVVEPGPEPTRLTEAEVRELQRLDQREAERRPLPDGWERFRSSETGSLMYVNTHTHTMQVAFPLKPARPKKLSLFRCCGSRPKSNEYEDEQEARLAHQEANLRPLPEGWQRVRASETGETYFLNTVTRRRVKEFPTQTAAQAAHSGGGCCSSGPPKPTVKSLGHDVHHLKVQVDDLYRQLSMQHHKQIEQWASRYRRRGILRLKRRIVSTWSQHTFRRSQAEAIVERMTGGRSKYGPKFWAFGRWVAMWRHSQRRRFEERARELEHATRGIHSDVGERLSHLEDVAAASGVGLWSSSEQEGRTMVMDGRAKTPLARLRPPGRRESGEDSVVIGRRRVLSPQRLELDQDDPYEVHGAAAGTPLRSATSSDMNRHGPVSVAPKQPAARSRSQPANRGSTIRSPDRVTRSRLLERRMRTTRSGDYDDDDLSSGSDSSSSDSEGEKSARRARERALQSQRRRRQQQQHQQHESGHQLLQKMRASPAASSHGRQMSRRRP